MALLFKVGNDRKRLRTTGLECVCVCLECVCVCGVGGAELGALLSLETLKGAPQLGRHGDRGGRGTCASS